MSEFTPATRDQLALTMGIMGASGFGKSFSALAIASGLLGETPTQAMEKQIAVIDSEGGKSALYSKGRPFWFSLSKLVDYTPEAYIRKMDAAFREGFKVVIIDGISDEWEGTLMEIDKLLEGPAKGDKRKAWGEMTPRHNTFIYKIRKAPVHLICTMLCKPAYEMVDDDRGKKKMQRIGLAPIQREGIERHFDIVLDMRDEAIANVTKTRCRELFKRTIREPGRELAAEILKWLEDGDRVYHTLEEILEELVPLGMLGPDPYAEASRSLARWCKSRELPDAEYRAAAALLKERVTAAVLAAKSGADVKPARVAPPPADDDAKRAADIDAGRA